MNLKKPLSSISWPEVAFLAEAEREPFADVQIVTLYAHCLNEAEELNVPLENIEACEFVRVHQDRVEIVIDADIVDDQAIADALDLMVGVPSLDVGSYYEYPPKKSFSYKRVH